MRVGALGSLGKSLNSAGGGNHVGVADAHIYHIVTSGNQLPNFGQFNREIVLLCLSGAVGKGNNHKWAVIRG